MTQLTELRDIIETVYQVDLGKLQRIKAEEMDLREALDDLDHQLRQSLDMSDGVASDWQAIGADRAWRAWVGRQRKELNMQLARVLVRKADAEARLKTSFAKKQVSEELVEQETQALRIERMRRMQG